MAFTEAVDSKQILTKNQKDFLEIVSGEKYLSERFYFTGGTPLAAFYLQHRLSEDIDLFSEEEIHLPSIRTFIGKAQRELKVIKVDYRNFYGLHSFQLFFLDKEILKVDFNYYPFPRIEIGVKYKKLDVDSAYDIAVNKIHTIAMQPRARDFIDVYFLIREKRFLISDLLDKAKAKFDWHIYAVQLGSRFLQAPEAADYPRMIKPISHEDWKRFFVEEAQKLKGEIFE